MLLPPSQAEFVTCALPAVRERGNTPVASPSGFGKIMAMNAIDQIMWECCRQSLRNLQVGI